jgi:HAD superfamily hydrolase (TIGR01509 family)
MNVIESVVFDMDGLMVDSEPVQFRAFNDVLAPLGVTVTEAEFIDMVGRRAIDNFRQLVEQYDLEESAESINARKNEVYLARMKDELKPLPGLFHALDLCESYGLQRIIASSSPRKDILATLDILGVTDRFSFIVSGDMVINGKPDPEIFIKTAATAGKPPSSFVVLEDTGHGVNAAKGAGMIAVAVPNRFTVHQDFSRADLVLNSLTELSIDILHRF